MAKRVLIIDDNHSFIDSLKVILKEFAFQYDHAFRFFEAEKKIKEAGIFVNRAAVNQLIELESGYFGIKDGKKKTANDDDETNRKAVPPISFNAADCFNEEGYSLIIIEQDTESSIKGLDFIQNFLRNSQGITETDFILLCGRLETIESRAKQLGVIVLEKPLKAVNFCQIVQTKIKTIQDLQTKVETIFNRFGAEKAIEINVPAKKIRAPKIKKPAEKIKKKK